MSCSTKIMSFPIWCHCLFLLMLLLANKTRKKCSVVVRNDWSDASRVSCGARVEICFNKQTKKRFQDKSPIGTTLALAQRFMTRVMYSTCGLGDDINMSSTSLSVSLATEVMKGKSLLDMKEIQREKFSRHLPRSALLWTILLWGKFYPNKLNDEPLPLPPPPPPPHTHTHTHTHTQQTLSRARCTNTCPACRVPWCTLCGVANVSTTNWNNFNHPRTRPISEPWNFE